MKSEYLTQKLEKSNFLGYMTSNNELGAYEVIEHKGASFIKREKFCITIANPLEIRRSYFDLNEDKLNKLKIIEEKISGIEQIFHRESHASLGWDCSDNEMIRIETWYKDAKNKLIITWEECYILTERDIFHNKDYYKVYDTFPEIYNIDTGLKKLELYKKNSKDDKKHDNLANIFLISTWASVFGAGIAYSIFERLGEPFLGALIGGVLIAANLASCTYYGIKSIKLVNQLNKIKPAFQGNDSLDRLCELYAIEKSR